MCVCVCVCVFVCVRARACMRVCSWLTLDTVMLVTVIHTVRQGITVPAAGDAVSSVQAQELILPALPHTLYLSAQHTHTHTSRTTNTLSATKPFHCQVSKRFVQALILHYDVCVEEEDEDEE